jgi:hypothetical protein
VDFDFFTASLLGECMWTCNKRVWERGNNWMRFRILHSFRDNSSVISVTSLSEVTCDVASRKSASSVTLFIEAVPVFANVNTLAISNPHSPFSYHCFCSIYLFKKWENFFLHLQSGCNSATILLSMLMHLPHQDGRKVMLHFMEAVMPQELWVCNVTTLRISFLVFMVFWVHNS